jgi:cytidylate kinase
LNGSIAALESPSVRDVLRRIPLAILPEFLPEIPMGARTRGATATMIIAIDGPAASGKSTASRAVARELGLTFLDTGAMYRAVTWVVLQRGVDVADGAACGEIARSVRLEFDGEQRIQVDGERVDREIRSSAVTRAVSAVSAHRAVRAAIVPRQRAEAERRGGIVAEGRDIGSVVFPSADFKFFLAASPEVRARRRAAEENALDRYPEILDDILRRDHLDSTREDSPLVRAADALLIDTDALDARAVVAAIVAHVRSKDRHARR